MILAFSMLVGIEAGCLQFLRCDNWFSDIFLVWMPLRVIHVF